jgi:hypothetical protein
MICVLTYSAYFFSYKMIHFIKTISNNFPLASHLSNRVCYVMLCYVMLFVALHVYNRVTSHILVICEI